MTKPKPVSKTKIETEDKSNTEGRRHDTQKKGTDFCLNASYMQEHNVEITFLKQNWRCFSTKFHTDNNNCYI